MTETPAPSATDPDRPAWAQSFYDRQLAMLSRLAETGLEIAVAIEGEAKAINAGETTHTPASAAAFAVYPRVARAVRLTLMLQDRVIRHLLGKDEPPPKGGRRDDAPAHNPVTEIIRTIVDPDPERFQRSERRERLDREALETGLSPEGLPAADLIAHICRDLGLDSEWSRQAALCWVHGDSVSDAPGWPMRCEGAENYSAQSP